jgi:hypothetical protein
MEDGLEPISKMLEATSHCHARELGHPKPGKILDSGLRRNDDNIGHSSIS